MTMIKGNQLCLSRSQRNYLIKVKAKLDIHSTLSDPFQKDVSHTMWLDTLSDRVSVDRVLHDGTYEITDRVWLNKLNENYNTTPIKFTAKGTVPIHNLQLGLTQGIITVSTRYLLNNKK